MTIFMTLLVRDEEDTIGAQIKYHLRQGVEHFIITDNLSNDGTPDIIEEFRRQGIATVIRETDDTYAQSRWVTRMARLAHDAGAEWVINNDADEFWITKDGSTLKDWFASQRFYNCVEAQRHDFLCVEGDEGPFWQRMIWRKTHSTNPLGNRLPPKTAHRAAKNIVVRQGNHDIDGFFWKRKQRNGLEILHFPLRSRRQYFRKIESGGRAYSQNTELSQRVGDNWRKQWDELQSTGTLSFVENNVFCKDQIDALVANGTAIKDQRLAGAMAEFD